MSTWTAHRMRRKPAPSIACVVLSYNSFETLSATLAAARAQTVPLTSLILVDNGSTEPLPEALETLVDRAILLPRNIGVGGGHNAGWLAALGASPPAEYVWALEHDCEPDPDCLERLLHTVESADPSHEEVAVVVPRQRHPDDERNRGPSLTGNTAFHLKTQPYVAPRMTFNGALIRVDAIRKVGLLREDFFVGHEDREYAQRLTAAGYAVVHDSAASVVHRNKGAQRRYASRSIVRDYYSARNELFLRRAIRRERFALSRMIVRSSLHVGRVVLMRDRVMARVRARIRALIDGFRGDLGPKEYSFLSSVVRR